jgi:hypothetical protein
MASLDVFWRKQCHLPSVSWYFFVVLSVLRRNSLHPAPFFHATTFFLKVCLEKMVCNFRRWSLMVHADLEAWTLNIAKADPMIGPAWFELEAVTRAAR